MIDTDRVYKTVLYILNKEQRGYLTPAEFNSVATQVQLEIFEKYFEDLHIQLRSPNVIDSEYANRVKMLQEKIAFFETTDELQAGYVLPADLHRFGTLEYKPITATIPGWPTNNSTIPVECEEVTQHEYNLRTRSPLTKPSLKWPIFARRENTIFISPESITREELQCYYIRKPINIFWDFTEGTLGQYINVPGGTNDFEISNIDQTEVIIKILAYSGIVIRDPQIVQAAMQFGTQEDTIEAS